MSRPDDPIPPDWQAPTFEPWAGAQHRHPNQREKAET